MKRIISLLTVVILIMSLCVTASATGSSVLSGDTEVTVGSEIEFTVSVSECGKATSIAVSVSFDSGFEIVSGTWLKVGAIGNFDTSKLKGALGVLASPDVNGDLFKLVLKAKTASVNNQTVSVNVIARNGSNEILNITTTKSVKISCATHSYGNTYTKTDKLQHSCTCTDCGYIEKFDHTWNDGKITKDPSEDETGIKTYTCTACGETKEDEIPRLTVECVTLKSAPAKTEYVQGLETLDLTGGYLTVKYDNDTTRDVALPTLTATGFDNSVLGEQTVTVKYGDHSVSFNVTVVKRKISNIAFIMPNIKEYILGDTLSTAGGSITVSYADGGCETKALTLDMLSGYDMNKTGVQYVEITYEGYEGYFKISVFPAGDTNGDGVIGALDISFLRKMLLGAVEGNNLCDVNRDGRTDILDLIRIKKLAA